MAFVLLYFLLTFATKDASKGATIKVCMGKHGKKHLRVFSSCLRTRFARLPRPRLRLWRGILLLDCMMAEDG